MHLSGCMHRCMLYGTHEVPQQCRPARHNECTTNDVHAQHHICPMYSSMTVTCKQLCTQHPNPLDFPCLACIFCLWHRSHVCWYIHPFGFPMQLVKHQAKSSIDASWHSVAFYCQHWQPHCQPFLVQCQTSCFRGYHQLCKITCRYALRNLLVAG